MREEEGITPPWRGYSLSTVQYYVGPVITVASVSSQVLVRVLTDSTVDDIIKYCTVSNH